MSNPTADGLKDLAQFIRELEADLFVQCPVGTNESAELQTERARARKNFDLLQVLVSAQSEVDALVEEIKDCCLRGKLSYGLGVALAAYKAVSAPRAAEGKGE
jgi:hypothetical protein